MDNEDPYDEIDTTVAEFDAMWEASEPVETITRYELRCPRCGEPELLLQGPLRTSMDGMTAEIQQDAMIVHKSTHSPECRQEGEPSAR